MLKRTNIELDTELLKKAMESTHLTTIKDVVNLALNELVKQNKRKSLLKFRGKVKWEGDLDEMQSI